MTKPLPRTSTPKHQSANSHRDSPIRITNSLIASELRPTGGVVLSIDDCGQVSLGVPARGVESDGSVAVDAEEVGVLAIAAGVVEVCLAT